MVTELHREKRDFTPESSGGCRRILQGVKLDERNPQTNRSASRNLLVDRLCRAAIPARSFFFVDMSLPFHVSATVLHY